MPANLAFLITILFCYEFYFYLLGNDLLISCFLHCLPTTSIFFANHYHFNFILTFFTALEHTRVKQFWEGRVQIYVYPNSSSACLLINSVQQSRMNSLCIIFIYFTKYPIHLTSANWFCPARLHGFKQKQAVTGKGIHERNLWQKQGKFLRGNKKKALDLEILAFGTKNLLFSLCLPPDAYTCHY